MTISYMSINIMCTYMSYISNIYIIDILYILYLYIDILGWSAFVYIQNYTNVLASEGL